MKKYWWSIIFLLGSASCLPAQHFSLVPDTALMYKGCVQLEEIPLDDASKESLQVFLLEQSIDRPSLPIVGDWIREKTTIYFCPLIPFNNTLTYQAQYPNLPNFTFKPTATQHATATELIHIYPSLTQLPENVLKLYLHFSAPMSEGNAYQFLTLKKENGEIVESPFLELQPLLWNEDRTRLTIWFDPGRVKRELLRNQKLGAPLEEDTHYTLSISKDWKDANGYSLDKEYTKKIEVIAADRKSPEYTDWQVTLPKANTKAPLAIHFGEPLDHALALKSLSIHTKDGHPVEGKVTLGDFEKEWQFIPTSNWIPTTYHIKIRAALEDVVGNNLNRLFDTNLDLEQPRSSKASYYYLDFLLE